MSKILVTGGLGLIGSNICRKLVYKEHDVMILDAAGDYSPALQNSHSRYIDLRFEGIKNKVTIKKGNITEKDIRKTLSEFKPDKVIHLAGVPIAVAEPKDIEQAIMGTCVGTANLLSVINEVNGVSRFIYASTSSVYGDFQTSSPDETHPLNPNSPYGGTKLLGEILVKHAAKRDKYEFVIIRPASVYGPTDLNERIIPKFIRRALRGQPLELNNNGEEDLDFTYVEDTAEGFVLATFEPKAANETFNISYGSARKTKDLAKIVKDYFPNVEIILKPEEADIKRPKRGTLDISKARKLLGFNPQYSLERGLEKLIEFERKDFVERELLYSV